DAHGRLVALRRRLHRCVQSGRPMAAGAQEIGKLALLAGGRRGRGGDLRDEGALLVRGALRAVLRDGVGRTSRLAAIVARAQRPRGGFDMIRRVVVFGTESTGKSMLAQALAAHYDEPWAEEYVRAFWDARGGEISAWDLATIARGQLANESAAEARARRLIFCDTN